MIDVDFIVLGNGCLIYAGKAPNTEVHGHHAVQIGISLDIPFKMKVSDGVWEESRGIIVGSDCEHECIAGMKRVLFLCVDPESSVGLFLTEYFLSSSPVNILDELKIDLYLHELAYLCSGNINPDDIMKATDLFFQNLASYPLTFSDIRRIDSRIKRAISILRATVSEKLPVGDLAGQVGLSQSRLVHLFKEQTGLPIRNYRLWLRIITAVEYFYRDANLTDSAHQAGFSDSAQFSRTFKRMFGINPSALLKNSQKVQVFILSVE